MGGEGAVHPHPTPRRPQRLKRYTPLGLIFNYLIHFTPQILRDARHRGLASLCVPGRAKAYPVLSSLFQRKVDFYTKTGTLSISFARGKIEKRIYKRRCRAYPFDIKNALFVGIAGKEPGTPLFLPCFSQAVRATLRFQPGHVIDAERGGLHVTRRPSPTRDSATSARHGVAW